MSAWHVKGRYFENCNCDFLCPCITSNLTAAPTEGDCKVGLAFEVDEGSLDGTDLSGVKFVVVMYSPGPMADGDLTVGLIIDDAASEAQADAITAIATGSAGGPMAALGPLVGTMAGVERRPVRFQEEGLHHSVEVGDLVSLSCDGVPGGATEGEPLYLDNTCHPVAARVALARAGSSRIAAFGIDYEDASGRKNGHFAPFAWSAQA